MSGRDSLNTDCSPQMRGDLPYAVVGGGLAGLGAAEAIVNSGKRVVLLERREELGGRASSFIDPETGWTVDNGHHIWMPCCTALTGLLDRTGAQELTITQPRFQVTFLEKNKKTALLKALNIPGPLHMLLPLLRFPYMQRYERAALIRALIALKMHYSTLEREGMGYTFLEWLKKHSQPQRVIDVFWEPVITSIVNLPVARVRADMAAMAVYEAFLAGRNRANLSWATRPLGEVWDLIARHITAKGGVIRKGTCVLGSEIEGGEQGHAPVLSALHLSGGERLPVAGAVMAVPPAALRRLLPPRWRDEHPFNTGMGLDWAPILNIHLWYRQPIIKESMLCILNSSLHWIISKQSQFIEGGRNHIPSTSQHLNLIISSSDCWLDKVRSDVVPVLLEELSVHLPAATSFNLLAVRMIHETKATISAHPGSESYRPLQETPLPNLSIAGAWTRTGWPSTLEGAVRSGRAAVRALGVNIT